MKFLLLLVVLIVAVWWFSARRRGPSAPTPPKADAPAGPTAMLACAHCGVHLPLTEMVKDSVGRPFCSEAHRLAGPR